MRFGTTIHLCHVNTSENPVSRNTADDSANDITIATPAWKAILRSNEPNVPTSAPPRNGGRNRHNRNNATYTCMNVRIISTCWGARNEMPMIAVAYTAYETYTAPSNSCLWEYEEKTDKTIV